MALVGENGAGKSTLVKILAGMFPADEGRICLGGKDTDLGAATRSEHAGIAVVQQELSLVPTLSIGDNLFLGDTRRGWRTATEGRGPGGGPYLKRSVWASWTLGLRLNSCPWPSSNSSRWLVSSPATAGAHLR